MKSNDEFVELRLRIERYEGDFGYRTRLKTTIENRSETLSEEFLDDIYEWYGIELSDSESNQ